MFLIILICILVLFYLFKDNLNFQEDFFSCACKSRKYPYNLSISTPQTNYNQAKSKINSQQYWKKDLSLALSPIPTIHCTELVNKTDCNKYGCNWFGSSDKKNSNSFCSSAYPTQF